MMTPGPYYCIHCGHQASQVYKTYAEGNLIKLLQCKNCGDLIDKYMEYDPIIIAINLVLQNQLAFRHVLLNTAFEGFWKLGVVFLFCASYCYWCFQKGEEFANQSSDFYEIEVSFYRVLLRVFFGTAVFHASILTSCFLRFCIFKFPKPPQFSFHTLWKGVNLCSCAEIFELIALIWAYSQTTSRILFVNALLIMSNIQSYQVITGNSKVGSAITILCCFTIEKLILWGYDLYMPALT